MIVPAVVAGMLVGLLPAAHDVDVTSVARVFLDQVGEDRYVLSVVDLQAPPLTDPAAVLPAGCRALSADDIAVRVRAGFAFACDRPLRDDDVLLLPWGLEGTVVLARWADGSEASAYFSGDGRSIEVPLARLRAGAGSLGALAGTYFVLGAEHILLGVDHLLFIVGLLLLVKGAWTLVATITAFTVAHSLTLGASVLGFVPVRTGPVEAAIALSIVLLAREIVAASRGEEHLVHRHPWLVAFGFGLLHGFGFAGALGQLGLRAGDIPAALFFFNVGVEAGQLVFVAAAVGFGTAVARRVSWPSVLGRVEPALGYGLGGLSMFWFVERLPAVFGG